MVTTSTAACPGGRTVELITIAGAGHQWPGAAPNPLAQRLLGTDPPSTALNATQGHLAVLHRASPVSTAAELAAD